MPGGIYLLIGPAGSGKTIYCMQFLRDGLSSGEQCVYISSNPDKNESVQFRSIKEGKADRANLEIMHVAHDLRSKKEITDALASILTRIEQALKSEAAETAQKGTKRVRIVVDSITHLLFLYGQSAVFRFMAELAALLSNAQATAICTLAQSERRYIDRLSTISAGILELKIEDREGALSRSIRLLSVKGVHHKALWVNFKISDQGDVLFDDQVGGVSVQNCTLCGKPIKGTALSEADFVFDTKTCLETYRKLSSALGMSISEAGLPSEAFDVSFFYIDIVGSSDPSMSVKKQVQKIELLNKFIGSCESFKRASKGKRIILPTGDGMAIGFLLNPELPLLLAIELHRELRQYNKGKSSDSQLGVRIGLASGPVFTVTDMNNVQNVWGPGIILARRVMDAGIDGHILLAEKLAEDLLAIKDDYRKIIRMVSSAYETKHGEKIKLYSAYSTDFGNSEQPPAVKRG